MYLYISLQKIPEIDSQNILTTCAKRTQSEHSRSIYKSIWRYARMLITVNDLFLRPVLQIYYTNSFCNKQFLPFPQCFLPFWITFAIFIKFEIVVCKVFEFGIVYNLSFGKGLNLENSKFCHVVKNKWPVTLIHVFCMVSTISHPKSSSLPLQ